MKHTKRVFGTLLCLFLCAVLLHTTAFAATTPSITLSSVVTEPGKDVVLSVELADNPGLMAMMFQIGYDHSLLTLTGIEDAGLTGWERNSDRVLWLGEADSSFSGTILKLKFHVSPNAGSGDLPVSLSCNSGDVGNHNEDPITPKLTAGKIHIHGWEAPTYVWSNDNSRCTATRVCKHDASHTETETVQSTSRVTRPAACESAGETTYTAVFTNPAFATQTKPVTNIAALGHDYKLTGWSWTGRTAAAATFTCSRDASHVQTVNAAITSERTEPTADKDGSIVYTAAVTFQGTKYTDTQTEILPATGRDYVLSGWTWDGVRSAFATFKDKNSDSEVRSDATITSSERVKPGCETAGEAVYTATVVFNGKTYTDEKTAPEEPLGHDWGAPSYKWSDDNTSVTATAVCKRDKTHELTETVKTNFILTQPSTFETTGTGYYLASFENALFEEQRKDVVVPAAACEGGDTCPSSAFTDMPAVTSYMHVPIDWAVVNQVTLGTSATKFGPQKSCTRAQFVTFLWRVKGQPEPESNNNPFEDVKEGAFYYKSVLWAAEQGVTSGTSATKFSPGKSVTRGQVVTFLWRFEGSEEPANPKNPFTDVQENAYYFKAMLWAVAKNITTGTSPTTFNPNGNCTRAQCVTFLYREFGK